MAVQTTITITHNKETIQTIQDKLLRPVTKTWQALEAIRNFFHAAVSRDRACSVAVQVNSGDAVAASGTITFSSLANNDTVTVGLQVFTAKTSGATGANQFNLGANDTAAAVAFAAKVNAHTSLTKVVTASPAAAVTTITSFNTGLIGNQIAIAISAHGSVSGSGLLASGANAVTYSASNTYHAGV